MALAIFDLDNTLLGDDSDYLWGQFLTEQQLVDKDHYERENKRFYEEYKAGNLDIMEFLAFSLEPLTRIEHNKLSHLHSQFMSEKIKPIILPKARELLDTHRDRGDTLLIITATNRFITAPIAKELNIEHLIATDPEMVDGRYTGRVAGTPCFREGKITQLEKWLTIYQQNLSNSWFYSDSHNDLALMEMVTQPVAVDPDETLAQHAEEKGWPVISLRE